jgi:hypothetical protein
VRQKSAATRNEAWIPCVQHKLLWPDARMHGAQLRITHHMLARVEMLARWNQQVPMK